MGLTRWIRGGVSVNYHTLSDFRVAQDGTRVRAHASLKSFRRRPTLEAALRVARQQVDRTVRQGAEHGARQAAAETRATREHEERIDAALAELPAVEAVVAAADVGLPLVVIPAVVMRVNPIRS